MALRKSNLGFSSQTLYTNEEETFLSNDFPFNPITLAAEEALHPGREAKRGMNGKIFF